MVFGNGADCMIKEISKLIHRIFGEQHLRDVRNTTWCCLEDFLSISLVGKGRERGEAARHANFAIGIPEGA